MTTTTFTTEDVDRLLAMADQFLEDWEEHEGGGDPACTERRDEWDAIRPLLVLSPALLESLEDLLGGRPDVQGGICQHCGRDYIGDFLEGPCPSDDCPAHRARALIVKAEHEQTEAAA